MSEPATFLDLPRGDLESFALLGHTVVRRTRVIDDLGARTLVLDHSQGLLCCAHNATPIRRFQFLTSARGLRSLGSEACPRRIISSADPEATVTTPPMQAFYCDGRSLSARRRMNLPGGQDRKVVVRPPAFRQVYHCRHEPGSG